jgi:hypothetical protein
MEAGPQKAMRIAVALLIVTTALVAARPAAARTQPSSDGPTSEQTPTATSTGNTTGGCSNANITNSNPTMLNYRVSASGAQFAFWARTGQSGTYLVDFFNGGKSPVYMAQEDFTSNKNGFVTLGVNINEKYNGAWTRTSFSFAYAGHRAAGGSQCP